ncbi:MAG: hypothetical protein R6W48_09195 [Gaiellaceae bacterium]
MRFPRAAGRVSTSVGASSVGDDSNKEEEVGISISILFIALGAILTWAVSAEVSGININAVGVILMITGAIGLLVSMIFWSSWGGFGGNRDAAGGNQTNVIRED